MNPLNDLTPKLAILFLGLSAFAAAPTAATEPPKALQSTLDLGFVNTAGNTEVTTLNAGEKTTFKHDRWLFGSTLALVYGRTSGETTANQLRAALRADYEQTPRWHPYGLFSFDRNRFAGISHRFEEGVGIGYKAILEANDTLDLEAGLSLTQERTVAPVSNTFVSARLAASYKHLLSKTAYFLQTVEVLPNLKESRNLRLNTESALVAPLSERIALKVGYIVRYDRGAPERGFLKTDRIFNTGIQLNF